MITSLSLPKMKIQDLKESVMKRRGLPSISFNHTAKVLLSMMKADMDKEKPTSENANNDILAYRSIETKWSQKCLETSLQKYKQKKNSVPNAGITQAFTKQLYFQKQKSMGLLTSYQQLSDHRRNRSNDKILKVDKKQIKQKKLLFKPSEEVEKALSTHNTKHSEIMKGVIKGYAACSLIGTLSTASSTRICIISNAAKTLNKQKQVSFFALYEGKHGIGRAQFLRENFHKVLLTDEYFYSNLDKAVSRTFEQIDREFAYNLQFDNDYSAVQLIICVIIGQTMSVIKSGKPNAIVSLKLGSFIKTLGEEKKVEANMLPINKDSSFMISIKTFNLNESFDFLILGNQSLFELGNSKQELGRNVWKRCFEQNILSSGQVKNNFDTTQPKLMEVVNSNKIMSQACNKICTQITRNDIMGRSVSMIAVCFSNFQGTFSSEEALILPNSSQKQGGEQDLQQ